MTKEQLELEIMAHRYLYYVLAEPVLSDFVYDQIETEARKICNKESKVHLVGSSLPSSYTKEEISFAKEILERSKNIHNINEEN